jgi:hypothetical protein
MWSAIDAAVNGARSHVVTVGDPGEPEAGALVTSIGSALSGGVTSRCLDGPVVPVACDTDRLQEILRGIDEVAARAGAETVRVGPLPTLSPRAGDPVAAGVFASRGYKRTEWRTRVVSLEADAALLDSFRKSARKAIRRAQEEEVTVVRCRTFEEYLALFVEPYAAANAIGDAIAGSTRLWDLDAGRAYRFFAALSSSGDVLATLGTYRFNGMATEVMSARTPAGREHSGPAQDLVHWEAFRYHRAEGDRLFDLAGYAPEPADAKEAGIRRFKEKFGGREITIDRFERAMSQPARRLSRALIRRLAPQRAQR